jgi:microcystin-dependent protein
VTEPFLGQIILVPYNFAPRGYAFCQGQILSIAQNTALFSLLGTTYGGNGQTTFALPDLRGRLALSSGQGPGLSNYSLGEQGGVESVTLIQQQMPQHQHAVAASMVPAGDTKPANNYLAINGAYVATAPNATMGNQMIGFTGGNQPHENREPYLCLNYCIALQGIFPSRN